MLNLSQNMSFSHMQNTKLGETIYPFRKDIVNLVRCLEVDVPKLVGDNVVGVPCSSFPSSSTSVACWSLVFSFYCFVVTKWWPHLQIASLTWLHMSVEVKVCRNSKRKKPTFHFHPGTKIFLTCHLLGVGGGVIASLNCEGGRTRVHLAFSATADRWSRCCHNYNIGKVLIDFYRHWLCGYKYYFNWSSMQSYWEDILTIFLREQGQKGQAVRSGSHSQWAAETGFVLFDFETCILKFFEWPLTVQEQEHST